MATNGSIQEPFPSKVNQPSTTTIRGFTITTHKLPISKAGPIEAMTEKLGIVPPEMIFGDNFVSIKHAQSGWGISFNAFDALDRVDKTGASMLQVAHSGEWQRSREHHHESIKEVVKPFDWSYSTDYKGTTCGDPVFQVSTISIPLELLKRPDPIRFFDEVMLYEDELADNGITMLSCKVRVMPDRLLLLSRLFMRLDNVLVRVRDTRVFVEFGTGEVIREYTSQEDSFDAVLRRMAARHVDAAAMMRDSNQLAQVLPIKEKSIESLVIR